MASTEPRRSEIWLVSFGSAKGDELGKNRPAVLISADELHSGSSRNLFVVVPLSSSKAPSPLRPWVSAKHGVESPSVAVCAAVRSVSRGRLLRSLGELDRETLAEVEFALSMVLGLG